MNHTKNKFLTTSDVAKKLGVSEHTVYNLVRRGELTPLNKETWQLEGGFYFTSDEIDQVRHRYMKPDLSTQDAANRLGVSITTILRYIKEGELPAYKRVYKGKMRHFIKEENLNYFITSYVQSKKKKRKNKFHSKLSGYFLFQPFRHKETNELARIVEFSDYDGKAITENGSEFYYFPELQEKGFEPILELEYGKPSTKRGYAKFEFPFPEQIKSTVYKVIELIYKTSGPQNMSIETTDDTILLQVKPTTLPLDRSNIDEIDLLKSHIVEGKVQLLSRGVLLESDFESIHAYVPSNLKDQVKKFADSKGRTIEEVVTEFIKEGLQRERENTQ